VIVLPAADEARFRSVAACMIDGMRTELRGVDEGLDVQIVSAQRPPSVVTRTDRDRLLRLMAALPHGVLGMSRDLPGLVETSSNLAVVQPGDGGWLLVTSSRSSVMPTLRAVQGAVRAMGELAGARVESADGYPGWKPNVESPLLAVVREVYADLWGRPPVVTAVHAGLECGLLGERIPGIDMVSFGPQIEGAHSPDERVHVPSVERFWNALTQVLQRLASRPA
jgi:dipeptidase D